MRELRGQLAKAVARRNELLDASDRVAEAIEGFVRIVHGDEAGALRHYGLTPHKKAVTTALGKFLATERRLETRRVRGTKGPRQQQRLKEAQVEVVGSDGQRIGSRGLPASSSPAERVTVTEVRPPPPEAPRQLPPAADDSTEP